MVTRVRNIFEYKKKTVTKQIRFIYFYLKPLSINKTRYLFYFNEQILPSLSLIKQTYIFILSVPFIFHSRATTFCRFMKLMVKNEAFFQAYKYELDDNSEESRISGRYPFLH